jgi:hypothetical protein
MPIHGTSSNATSEMSSGISSPRRRSTCHASSASVLFAAKIALGRPLSSSAEMRAPASGACAAILTTSLRSTRSPASASAAR